VPEVVVAPPAVPDVVVAAPVVLAAAEVVGVDTAAGAQATRAASAVAATMHVTLVRVTLSLKIPPDT
jgi:hypothetical protein